MTKRDYRQGGYPAPMSDEQIARSNRIGREERESGVDNVIWETIELAVPATITIRAMGDAALLKEGQFRRFGRALVALKLKPQEVRGFVSSKLWEGLGAGIRYETAEGDPFALDPETIEEAFDGRPTLHLPADVSSWADEPMSYDRSIAEWLKAAAADEITKAPSLRWLVRLRLIQMAFDTPTFVVQRAY